MATHSSSLAWKIPWMEEPDRYSPWGHKESDKTFTFFFHILRSVLTLGKTGGSYTHSSVLAWRIPGIGEPGGVTQSQTRLK